jgi:D-glycero-alpha-D-manno-heptose-7-phosphate kinase
MKSVSVIEATAPARVDLAGGTLDLWPLHVLHPGSVTVNLAIDRRATCRVRRAEKGVRLIAPDREIDLRAGSARELRADPRTALVAALVEEICPDAPVEVEFLSGVPFGSGLGGSSALAVAVAAALTRMAGASLDGAGGVELVRDVETRVLGKPAGVQDYYPAFGGGLHCLWFQTGRTVAERLEIDPAEWDRHLTLFDTGAAHSSGMNNWEVFRRRLEGETGVTRSLDSIARAAREMAAAVRRKDFPAMGRALKDEWQARRELAPVVSSPAIERAIARALQAGAWGGKACGAGGGGCVVFLAPADRTGTVREALERIDEGRVLSVRAEPRGLEILQLPG